MKRKRRAKARGTARIKLSQRVLTRLAKAAATTIPHDHGYGKAHARPPILKGNVKVKLPGADIWNLIQASGLERAPKKSGVRKRARKKK